MAKNFVRITLAVLVLVAASFAVNVTVSSPIASSTVSSPVSFQASATSSYPITGWRIYVDGVSVYTTNNVSSISTSVAMATGTHQVIVRAWDSTGAYGSSNLQVTVGTTSTSGSGGVSITSPTNGSTVASPVHFVAAAYSVNPITAMRVYVDGISAYLVYSNRVDTYINMSAGTHYVVAQAWDSTGAVFKAPETITVSGGTTPAPSPTSGTGPVPPSNATVVSNIQNRPNWGKCSSPSCSGGVGTVYTYWMAQFQTTPSLSGSSAQFFIDGPAYTDDLFWNNIGANGSASRFIHDFYVYTDSATPTAAEALEFDLVQVVNGRKFNWSTECHYTTGKWDIWNEATQHWIPSNATCAKFTPNTWHHVQWALERISTGTHYLSVTVDGVTQQISSSIAYQPAPPTSWANSVIVQVQQDLSSNPGSGYHEWVDKHTVYEW